MIKNFINKLLGKTGAGRGKAAPKFGKRVDVPADVHRINPELVDRRALDVVHTLKQAGFEAYIVGGAVRDLLLGLAPKDFDVATNATPEQVKGLFRRAFIIGRRFRIVHVVYGRGREHEVIEVSTFRAHMDNAAAEQVAGNEKSSKRELAGMTHAVDSSGRVLRDNVWGPMEEDAARRDFTINAMYYDPERQMVVDYHHGIRDAQKKVLRMIGDPATRYREDPVRIIRAVRFAAKLSALGFTFEPKTGQPLVGSVALLADVPQSRMFDEMLKLLQTGHATASVNQLRQLGLAKGIYPLLDLAVERADLPFVAQALQDTDRRVGEGKPVAPSFLLACVLWSDVREGWARRVTARQPAFSALQDAVDEVFDARIGDVSGRGKLGADMREIWTMQPRFERRSGNSPFSLADQPRFRAGFDFLRLRALVGEIPEELAHWWETFSTADDAHRNDMIEAIRLEQSRAKSGAGRKTKVHRVSADGAAPGATGEDDPRWRTADGAEGLPPGGSADAGEPTLGADGSPARKRRRRRRKPGGAGEGGEASPRGDGGRSSGPDSDA
ncbi:MAG: polynucleotide adenylyltransferase PcnB [Polaromonas sp.]|nr:polynucleotide adenylyltransferase PcnB [Polaromonas sp.]